MPIEEFTVKCNISIRTDSATVTGGLGLPKGEYEQLYSWAEDCLAERGNVLECLADAFKRYSSDCRKLVLAIYLLGGVKAEYCTNCQQSIGQVVPVIVLTPDAIESLLRDIAGSQTKVDGARRTSHMHT